MVINSNPNGVDVPFEYDITPPATLDPRRNFIRQLAVGSIAGGALLEISAREAFAQSSAGAVAQTVQVKGYGSVNVKDFGAVGDGVTDDAPAVQKAINAVSSGTVFFPMGSYLVGRAGLSIANKTGVILSGAGATIKIGGVSTLHDAFGSACILFHNSSNCGINNVTIQGNNHATTAISLYNCTDCVIDNNNVSGCGKYGLINAIGGGSRNRITNNTLFNPLTSGAAGIRAGNYNATDMENNIYVVGNNIYDCHSGHDAMVISSNGGRIADNFCSDSTGTAGTGINFGGANGYASNNLTISNNIVMACGEGIQSDVIYKTDADIPSRITISGNVLYQNMNAGIYVPTLQNSAITGNICINNNNANVTSFNGIDLTNKCYEVIVTGNLCLDTRSGASVTQDKGIAITSGISGNPRDITISGNICKNNKTNGIFINAAPSSLLTGITIIGNVCNHNLGYGISITEVDPGSITFVTVIGNSCNNNKSIDLRTSLLDVIAENNRYNTEQDVSHMSFPENSATPSVYGRRFWRANNGSPTIINAFNSGQDGQEITILAANGNTTIAHGRTLILKGATPATLAQDQMITLVRQGKLWREKCRSF